VGKRKNSPVLVPLAAAINESFSIDAGGEFKFSKPDP
jgi:hypothetical protein